ncbi:MAG: hypothetical protein H0V82_03490 [Candidatus Protochlamydia sp.]|nr:hypothetical protein [Candidatus Protochlamydia sp.]
MNIWTNDPAKIGYYCSLNQVIIFKQVDDCVMGECDQGHTFEKSAIEAHLKIKDSCPINRELITSLSPNYTVKSLVDELKIDS